MALWCDFLLLLCIMFTWIVIGTNADQCNVVNVDTDDVMPPGNAFIEHGKPLEIYCVVDDEFVEKNGQSASSRLTFLQASSGTVKIINSTAIRLRIENPPPSEVWYTCLLDNEKPVCVTNVTVGTKPKPVNDFKCVSSNWDDLLCTWSAQENYVKTSYQLTYRLEYGSWFPCPSPPETVDNGVMSCFWNLSTSIQYRPVHEHFLFNLTAKNRFGKTEMLIPFNNFQNVIPAPPERLRVLNKTSKSLYLQWRVPSSLTFFPPGVDHRILYRCEYESKKWKSYLILHTYNVRRINFNLTRLAHANAMCNVKVSLRSAMALPNDESMWSANATISARLKTEVPGAPPKTTPGCFEVISTDRDKIRVYVFWQLIPRKLHNGPNFRYNISIDGEPHIRPETITKTYAKFEDLSASKNYTFKIWSENDDGPSARASKVYLKFDRPMEPSRLTKIDFEDGRYKLEWETPKRISAKHPLTNYTLFWCDSFRDWPYKCSGYLNWTTVPSTKTSKVICVKSKDDIYQFAVSANSDSGASSGMVWADRILLSRQLDVEKVQAVNLDVYINTVGATYIDVAWRLTCSNKIRSVKGFILYYCKAGRTKTGENYCLSEKSSIKIDGDYSFLNLEITKLEPSTTYIISVAALPKDGEKSIESEKLVATTLDKATTDSQ